MSAPSKRTADYIATQVDDEIVLIGLDGGELFSLMDTGRAIWELIDGQRTQAAIVDQLLATYDGDRTIIEADIRALITDLAQAGLIDA